MDGWIIYRLMEGRKENKWTDGWMKDRRKESDQWKKEKKKKMEGLEEKDGWMERKKNSRRMVG